jgi:predicted dehydrogenase
MVRSPSGRTILSALLDAARRWGPQRRYDLAVNRRVFLGIGAAAVMNADVLPGNRVSLGVIGAGWMGLATMKIFMGDPRVNVTGICDIDQDHLAEASAAAPGARTFHEFEELLARPDIDAVYAAVPDHWHAIVAVSAARAGKDIYGEKPLAHDWAEGKAICDAVARYGRVWQTGSWQRSLPDFRFACELVRNGRIGKVSKVEVGLPAGLTDWDGLGHLVEPGPPPKTLDWQRWLGPAPWVPYAAARVHKTWRWNYDTGGGSLMDWVGHHVDIAHWGLGLDDSGPVSVEGRGEPSRHPIWDTPPRWRVMARYAGGMEMLIAGGYDDVRPGTKWIGDQGWVWVDRSGMETFPAGLLTSKIAPGELRLPVTASHHRQFIDCVLTRGETLTPAHVALRSATPGFLGNIAMRTGQTIRWDPVRQEMPGDPAAQRLLARTPRSPWII